MTTDLFFSSYEFLDRGFLPGISDEYFTNNKQVRVLAVHFGSGVEGSGECESQK